MPATDRPSVEKPATGNPVSAFRLAPSPWARPRGSLTHPAGDEAKTVKSLPDMSEPLTQCCSKVTGSDRMHGPNMAKGGGRGLPGASVSNLPEHIPGCPVMSGIAVNHEYVQPATTAETEAVGIG